MKGKIKHSDLQLPDLTFLRFEKQSPPPGPSPPVSPTYSSPGAGDPGVPELGNPPARGRIPGAHPLHPHSRPQLTRSRLCGLPVPPASPAPAGARQARPRWPARPRSFPGLPAGAAQASAHSAVQGDQAQPGRLSLRPTCAEGPADRPPVRPHTRRGAPETAARPGGPETRPGEGASLRKASRRPGAPGWAGGPGRPDPRGLAEDGERGRRGRRAREEAERGGRPGEEGGGRRAAARTSPPAPPPPARPRKVGPARRRGLPYRAGIIPPAPCGRQSCDGGGCGGGGARRRRPPPRPRPRPRWPPPARRPRPGPLPAPSAPHPGTIFARSGTTRPAGPEPLTGVAARLALLGLRGAAPRHRRRRRRRTTPRPHTHSHTYTRRSAHARGPAAGARRAPGRVAEAGGEARAGGR